MKLLGAHSLVLVGLTTVGLAGCIKQSKAPEAPRKGANSSDGCAKPAEQSSPEPSGSYGGGAYLADKVEGTWAAVKVLLERDCLSCHPQYADHANASIVADRFVETTDDGSMPKNGEKLSLEDRKIYIAWAIAGAPDDGSGPATGTGSNTDTATDTSTATGTGTGEGSGTGSEAEPTPPTEEGSAEPSEEEAPSDGEDENTSETGCV